jgi:hypothetical protein
MAAVPNVIVAAPNVEARTLQDAVALANVAATGSPSAAPATAPASTSPANC